MPALDARDQSTITEASTRLREIQKQLPLLKNLAWPAAVRRRFLRGNARRLPQVEYPTLDLSETTTSLNRFRQWLPDSLPHRDWLLGQARVLESTAGLLANRGTQAFSDYSQELFGKPDDPLPRGRMSPLALSRTFTDVLGDVRVDDGRPQGRRRSSRAVARRMREMTTELFGEQAPEILLVEELSANALAGRSRVRIRQGARFTSADIGQLAEHEIGVHVATAINGDLQTRLPMLGASHAGTTRTQEGLAVFAEFITGNIELQRLRRLANRVEAIEMAMQGADFIEVFHFFEEQETSREQAFENARRVFRGGVISGGAPFTKDIVYLDGLLRVHNFLRTAIGAGRADVIPLLFAGKFNLESLPTLAQLLKAGMLEAPRFLPDWIRHRGFLVAYLAYSGFLNAVNLEQVGAHYRSLLTDMPALDTVWAGSDVV